MGWKDSFSEASMIIKLALVVVFIALFCSWIAFTTSSWLVSDLAHVGLWRRCGGVTAGCGLMDGTAEVEFGVSQAFGIIGFVCQNVAFLLILFFIFKESCRGSSEVGLAAAGLMIVSSIGWLIAVAVFGGSYSNNYYLGANLHYSYGLAVVACLLGILGGILTFLGSGNGSVGSK